MSKQVFNYKIKELILFTIIWEILFWFILCAILFIFGYFGNHTGQYLDFEKPHYLYFFPFTLLITLIFFFTVINKNKIFLYLGEHSDQTYVKQSKNTSIFVKYWFFKNTVSFLLLALAQPAFGIRSYSTLAENTQILLVIDVSNSMNVDDINQTTRLNIAKQASKALINQCTSETIGIILFAEEAIDYLPFTNDYYSLNTYIDEINTDLITNQGSSINNCIKKIALTLPLLKGISQKIFIVTDGEFHDHLDEKIKHTIKWKDYEMAIIGIGTEKGGIVPNAFNKPQLGAKRNKFGQIVYSKLNRSEIQKLAKEFDAYHLIVETPYPDFFKIYLQLKEGKIVKKNAEIFIAKNQKYPLLIIIAILQFTAYLLWNEKYILLIDKLLQRK